MREAVGGRRIRPFSPDTLMKTTAFGLFFAAAAAAFPAQAADWPDWAMNPAAEGGIAAADCADASGNLSMDRSMVVANARTALAQEINTRVKAVDKVYSQRVQKSGREPVTVTVFQRASEQITYQALQSSRVARFEVIRRTFGANQVCALVVMGGKEAQTYFNDLVRVSRAEVTPQDKEQLFDTFRARKIEK